LNEKTKQLTREQTEENIYPSPYEAVDGCLCKVSYTRHGESYTRLCNFAPRIMSVLTIDDGTEQTCKYLIGGTDENGRELPPVEIAAT